MLATLCLFGPVHAQSTASSYAANRDRLRSMTVDQRRKVVERYRQLLGLPPEQRERIYRLDAAIQKQAPDQRTRYYRLMDRYHQWKQTLPHVQRKRLDDASPTELSGLVAEMRRAEVDDQRQIRPYWFMLDKGGPRRQQVADLLTKIDPNEMAELDHLMPMERMERLRQLGWRHNVLLSGQSRPGPRLPAILPKIEPDLVLQFIETLPEEKKAELRDLTGLAYWRRAVELYFEMNPSELRERAEAAGIPLPARPGDALPRGPFRPLRKDR
jgi:hypothetical protein